MNVIRLLSTHQKSFPVGPMVSEVFESVTTDIQSDSYNVVD